MLRELKKKQKLLQKRLESIRWLLMKEALYYEKKEDLKVKCLLCPKYCMLSSGDTGICRVRKNIDGTLYALSYGKITGYH